MTTETTESLRDCLEAKFRGAYLASAAELVDS